MPVRRLTESGSVAEDERNVGDVAASGSARQGTELPAVIELRRDIASKTVAHACSHT